MFSFYLQACFGNYQTKALINNLPSLQKEAVNYCRGVRADQLMEEKELLARQGEHLKGLLESRDHYEEKKPKAQGELYLLCYSHRNRSKWSDRRLNLKNFRKVS